MEMNIFTEYRRKFRKNQLHAATDGRMLRGKSKAQKEKSLPRLNHFLTEKSCEISRKIELSGISLVRCADKAAHSALPPHRLPQTPALPLPEPLSLWMQTR